MKPDLRYNRSNRVLSLVQIYSKESPTDTGSKSEWVWVELTVQKRRTAKVIYRGLKVVTEKHESQVISKGIPKPTPQWRPFSVFLEILFKDDLWPFPTFVLWKILYKNS